MAALAAGVATSMAQNVYSLNIVGYYNVPLTVGHPFTAVCAQLVNGTPQNRADFIVPYADGDSINTFANFSYHESDMDSGSSTGWTDPATASDLPLTALPILSPGRGFFYGNNGGRTNITFVGQVPTGTNNVTVLSGLTLVGSMLPYSGLISTTNASNSINLVVPDGTAINTFNGVTFHETDRDSGSGTGWTDAATASDTPEPTMAVGQAFFVNNAAAPFNWQQVLNP